MLRPRGRQRRPASTRSARSRPSSSATTGARRSPGTRRCCAPTCSAPSAGLSVPFAPAGRRPARPTPSARWAATRSSTSSTSSSRAGPRPRSRRTCAGWLLGLLLHAPRATRRRRCRRGTDRHDPARRPKMRDRFSLPGRRMPAWLTEADLDVYAGEFERTGFTGGLNRYRNVDRDWEDLAAFRGQPIDGAGAVRRRRPGRPDDLGQASIDRFPTTLPKLHRSVILARLRPLDPAGAPGRGQRGAARLPRGDLTVTAAPWPEPWSGTSSISIVEPASTGPVVCRWQATVPPPSTGVCAASPRGRSASPTGSG